MSILTAAVHEGDEVFAAFAQGHSLHDGPVRSESLSDGVQALVSHGVTVALRDEYGVVFDARPHAEGERCVCRVVAHAGRAGVHVYERFEDDEVSVLDHGAFVALTARLRGA